MAALLLPACSMASKSTSQKDIEPTPMPTTATLANPMYTVQRGEVIGTITMTGSVTPVNQQSLFFSVDGHVHTVYVNMGDTVKVGTVIADLDGVEDLQHQLELSQIQLEQTNLAMHELTSPEAIANAKLAITTAELDVINAQTVVNNQQYWKNETLIQYYYANYVIAKDNLDKAQTAYDNAKVGEYINNANEAVAYQNLYNAQQAYNTAHYYYSLYSQAPTQRQMDEAQANLDLAKAQLTNAQNYLTLLTGGNAPDDASGTALEAYKQANLDVQKATVGIQVLQDTIGKNQIISTMAGQLTALQISAGDQVHAYGSVGTIADVSQLEVSSSITDFSILNQLEVGMNATMISSSGVGKPLTGSIRLLPSNGGNTQASNQSNIIHFFVDSPLADAGYKLDDLVKITVILTKKENVLWVPPQTIRTFSGRQFVVVQDGNVQRRVDVSVGVVGTDRVEILNGLSEGQVVVSP
jgi:multidrug efflux pump subunit AcrA (membrane-fusion protein)